MAMQRVQMLLETEQRRTLAELAIAQVTSGAESTLVSSLFQSLL